MIVELSSLFWPTALAWRAPHVSVMISLLSTKIIRSLHWHPRSLWLPLLGREHRIHVWSQRKLFVCRFLVKDRRSQFPLVQIDTWFIIRNNVRGVRGGAYESSVTLAVAAFSRSTWGLSSFLRKPRRIEAKDRSLSSMMMSYRPGGKKFRSSCWWRVSEVDGVPFVDFKSLLS